MPAHQQAAGLRIPEAAAGAEKVPAAMQTLEQQLPRDAGAPRSFRLKVWQPEPHVRSKGWSSLQLLSIVEALVRLAKVLQDSQIQEWLPPQMALRPHESPCSP